jgi:hypothetical protein
LIVRAGKTGARRLVKEQRDLIADFEKAFGRQPDDGIHGVAIFTDNDDTGQPIVAYCGEIWLECAS